MFTSGTNYDFLLYIQAIIWFILAGFLIYLINKNKLTYVDEFRRKFVSGIYLLIFSNILTIFFQVIIKIPQEFYLILYSFVTFLGVGFMILTLIGISQLIDHISSIIDFETKNKKKYAILISAIITIIISILFGISRLNDATQISFIFAIPIVTLFYFYTSTYTFLLHQEMKKIDLNFLLYISLSFFTFGINLIPGIFLDMTSDAFYWVIIYFINIGFILILIIGYLDFKKKINRGLNKSSTK